MTIAISIILTICFLDFAFVLYLVFRKREPRISHEDDWELDERAAREKLPESPW